jgi:hypothetical protein
VFVPERQGNLFDDLLYDNYIGALCTVIIRTGILKSLEGFDERFPAHQDLDLYVRVADISHISFVNKCLARVRHSSNNRISLDFNKKLVACSLFWEKHSCFINRSLRLRHRAASRVFVYAVVLPDIHGIKKCLSWAFLGLFIDPKNFLWMLRSTASLLYKEKIANKIRKFLAIN